MLDVQSLTWTIKSTLDLTPRLTVFGVVDQLSFDVDNYVAFEDFAFQWTNIASACLPL
jgi:hypothetical protein